MIESLIVSNILLWVAVMALLVAVIALSRQIGILYERIAPMGALMMDTGPKVGEAAPVLDLLSLDGQQISIGAPNQHSTLLFFLSPTCPVCKKLLPILRSVQTTEASWVKLIFCLRWRTARARSVSASGDADRLPIFVVDGARHAMAHQQAALRGAD